MWTSLTMPYTRTRLQRQRTLTTVTDQTLPWVGLIHGLDRVGLGWVGSKIFIITVGWVGLGLHSTHIQRMLTEITGDG